MADYTGMLMDRELARLRHAELLEESANERAERAAGGARPSSAAWLALSLVVVVLVAGAAWLVFLG